MNNYVSREFTLVRDFGNFKAGEKVVIVSPQFGGGYMVRSPSGIVWGWVVDDALAPLIMNGEGLSVYA